MAPLMILVRSLGVAVLLLAGCAHRPSDGSGEQARADPLAAAPRPADGTSRSYAVHPGTPGCGSNPMDWCPSPPGDPCGVHRNEKDCRADPHCKGMEYHGESVIPCNDDGTGFWRNCPAVGCISR
jgi:hypothetical protein